MVVTQRTFRVLGVIKVISAKRPNFLVLGVIKVNPASSSRVLGVIKVKSTKRPFAEIPKFDQKTEF